MGKKVPAVTSRRVRRKATKETRSRGSHRNKYENLAPKRKDRYSAEDKTVRYLPIAGKPGETKLVGSLRTDYHERQYVLAENVVIPEGGSIYARFTMRK